MVLSCSAAVDVADVVVVAVVNAATVAAEVHGTALSGSGAEVASCR